MGGEGKRLLLLLLLALWVLMWGYSFAAFATTPAAGDGFARGLNRVTAFFGWQMAAALPAFAAWIVGRDWPKGSGVRIATRIPLQLALGLAAVVIGPILFARIAG